MALFSKKTQNTPRGDKTYNRKSMTTYYRSDRDKSNASPFKRKQPKKAYRKWIFGIGDILLIGLLLAGLIYSLILKPEPKVHLSDSSYRSVAQYRVGIQPFFGAVKDRNKISFDETAIVGQIQKQFPEVQSSRIELPFFSQQPVAWLYISPPAFQLISGGNSYVVDSQGIVVAESKDLPKMKKLITLNDQSGYPAKIGRPVLSSSSVDFINTVLSQSKKAGVPISELSLPPLAQELDLKTQDKSYYVKFYLGGDALNQTGQFLASRQKLAQTNQNPAEYLDVRVEGKVFYK